jgi:hypothetical protein
MTKQQTIEGAEILLDLMERSHKAATAPLRKIAKTDKPTNIEGQTVKYKLSTIMMNIAPGTLASLYTEDAQAFAKLQDYWHAINPLKG